MCVVLRSIAKKWGKGVGHVGLLTFSPSLNTVTKICLLTIKLIISFFTSFILTQTYLNFIEINGTFGEGDNKW